MRSESMTGGAWRCALGLVAAGVILGGTGVAGAQVGIGARAAESMNLDGFQLQRLVVPQGGAYAEIELELSGEASTIVAFRHSGRAPGFRAHAYDDAGELVEVDPGPVRTYRGMVRGVRGSRVAGSIVDGQLRALLRLGEDEVWAIQPATDADPDADRDLYLVYESRDVLPGPWTCGTPDNIIQDVLHQFDGASPEGGNPKICEIAWDADFEYYQLNGSSVPNTVTDIENILNSVEAIYLNDVNVGYLLTDVIVRNSPSDPYTTNDPSGLLSQFQQEWLNNQGAIHRDVAHMMTGKNLAGSVIGISFGGGICSQFFGYSLSQSKFSNNFILRTALTAHEVGHDWTAQHCDGQNDCAIMCSAINSCPGGSQKFGAAAKAKISGLAAVSPCLDEDIISGEATWEWAFTTTNGDDLLEVGETGTVTLSLDFNPDVDGVDVLGLAATIFDVNGGMNASNGHVTGWTVENQLADLTGDLTETDGVSLFNVNAGQLTAFGPFSDADPIDVLSFDWEADVNSGYVVEYTTSTETMVVWKGPLGDEVGVDWVPIEADVLFQVTPGAVCPPDCNGDGQLNILDFVCFQNEWVNQTAQGDCDGNGEFNILDFVCYQNDFVQGCP